MVLQSTGGEADDDNVYKLGSNPEDRPDNDPAGRRGGISSGKLMREVSRLERNMNLESS